MARFTTRDGLCVPPSISSLRCSIECTFSGIWAFNSGSLDPCSLFPGETRFRPSFLLGQVAFSMFQAFPPPHGIALLGAFCPPPDANCPDKLPLTMRVPFPPFTPPHLLRTLPLEGQSFKISCPGDPLLNNTAAQFCSSWT